MKSAMRKTVLAIGAMWVLVGFLLFSLNVSTPLAPMAASSYVEEKAALAKEEEPAPRHVFYHKPRVHPNPGYAETCYPAGEVMGVLPDNKCCEGLDSLTVYDEALPDCSRPLLGAVVCSDCGNKKCEYGENNCNCPEDCDKPKKKN